MNDFQNQSNFPFLFCAASSKANYIIELTPAVFFPFL